MSAVPTPLAAISAWNVCLMCPHTAFRLRQASSSASFGVISPVKY